MRRTSGQRIARGEGKWLLRVFVGRDANGKRQYTSKLFDGKPAQANEELRKMLREHDTKTLVRRTHHTLSEYITEWLKTKAQITEATLHGYKQHLDLYILPALGHLKLHDITPLVLQDAISKLKEKVSPRTIEYAHTVLHQALQKAVKLGFLVRNPTEDTELPPKVRRAFTILSPDQMVKLLESEKGKRLYPLWLMLLSTGLRPGEALATKWSDLEGDTLFIRRTLVRDTDGSYTLAEEQAKTEGSLRSVTLSKALLDALTAHRKAQAAEILKYGERYERHDFIFAARFGGFLDANNVRNRWKTALKRAKLPTDVRLYDTRHSHATALLNKGVNLAWVSARLGHSSVKVTEAVYARVLPEAHREMADVMDAVLDEAQVKRAAQG